MTHIDTHWQYNGLRVVRLENEHLCVDILPELGAKIYNLVHKPSGRNLLWQHPHVLPERQVYGAAYDDTWCGGWDELLPNDLPRPAPGGDLLPDHGEFWSQAAEWQVTRATSQVGEVCFTHYGRVLPTRFEKTVRLEAGASCLAVHYRYTNLGPDPIDFLWNIHPALAVSPNSRIDVPAGQVITDPWRELDFRGNSTFQWPMATDRNGNSVDLRRLPPAEDGTADMHYMVDVRQGWYAVTDQAQQVGFGLVFPKQVFPHVWLFRPLGGWRGLYTLILEASTGYPYDLDVARQQGTCGHLAPGAVLEADVLAVTYAGLSSVESIEPDGRVIPA